jgi:Ca2+-binding RTX toxin-like protein
MGSAPHVGDIFYSSAFEGSSESDFVPGQISYRTVLHEVAHAVFGFGDVSVTKGLNGAYLPADLNYNGQTVMSYAVAPGATVGDGNAISGNTDEFVRGPMVLDIQAAQWLYGANISHATGDDLYTFAHSETYYQTIWDAGGNDTISAKDAEIGVHIDLRPGSLSDLGSSVIAGMSGGVLPLKTVGIALGTIIENVVGGSGDDILTGNDAANVIHGGKGNDIIDGGDGRDTAYIDTAILGATVTINTDGTVTAVDRDGPQGADEFTNVEQLVFNDQVLDLDNYTNLTKLSSPQFADLAKVYVAYFNRAADAEGLFFWADKLAEGMDMTAIAAYFSRSEEAKVLYPDMADTSVFVTAVYANVLGRTPDEAGFEFWKTALNSGAMQPATFVLNIIGGAVGPDITYLSNKANLGVYFAAIKGMSDVADAKEVLNIFGDQAASNLLEAKTAADSHYADATTSGGGEFLFNLVGIVDAPFSDIA